MPPSSRSAARARGPGQRPGAKRANAKPKARRAPAKSKRRGLDLYHLLAVVSGAFTGLVLYSLVTPGQLPNEQAVVKSDPRASLKLTGLSGGRGADGLMHVRGQVLNGRSETCRLASVTVRFLDRAGQPVATTMATVTGIAGRSKGAFEARAHAPGAARFEATVDLAHFEPTRGKP